MSYDVLPDHAAILPSAHLDGQPTIHVRLYQVGSEHGNEKQLIDTRCTIEPPYKGKCGLCGKNGHDMEHCRWRGHVTGKNGEHMVNLVCLSWYSDQVLEDHLAIARKDGFLKSATEAEMQWVRKTVSDLREEKKLLLKQNASKYQRSSSPSIYGPAPASL